MQVDMIVKAEDKTLRMMIWRKDGAACSHCLDLEYLQEEERVRSIKRERRDLIPDDDDVAGAVNWLGRGCLNGEQGGNSRRAIMTE